MSTSAGMSETDKDQKTELPTQKRLEEAREKGQFARSTEIGTVFGLVAALAVLSFTLTTSVQSLSRFSSYIFGSVGTRALDEGSMLVAIRSAVEVCAKVLLPIVAGVMVAAIVAGGLQSGFRLSPKAVGFKPEKLDPIKGFGRVFSKKTLTHAGLDVLKLIALCFMLWAAVEKLLVDPLFSTPLEVGYLGDFIQRTSASLMGRMILALAIIAALAYAYEWRKNFEEMKMSRQELKDEHKNAEGDQLVKQAMRRMARRLLQKQMLAAVPTADVVITNPTHYAVALRYERGKDAAPVVLAKGDNRFARRIKELAQEHEVPMVENKPVARMLFKVGQVDEPIPENLFTAVAEILAFVYQKHRYYFFQLASRRAALAEEGKA